MNAKSIGLAVTVLLAVGTTVAGSVATFETKKDAQVKQEHSRQDATQMEKRLGDKMDAVDDKLENLNNNLIRILQDRGP